MRKYIYHNRNKVQIDFTISLGRKRRKTQCYCSCTHPDYNKHLDSHTRALNAFWQLTYSLTNYLARLYQTLRSHPPLAQPNPSKEAPGKDWQTASLFYFSTIKLTGKKVGFVTQDTVYYLFPLSRMFATLYFRPLLASRFVIWSPRMVMRHPELVWSSL